MLIYLIYTNFIYFYCDTIALGSNYAVNEQDFRWVVIHEFERHGWLVQDVYIGNPMKHHEKYLEINEAFAGWRRLMPFINRQNNEDLILVLQTAGVSRGRNGFRKDKGARNLPKQRKTSCNTAPMAQTLSTLSISAVPNSPNALSSPISISGIL